MSVFAIMMVRDEIDVIDPLLRHVAAQGVAGIIVADNGSVDGTRDVLHDMEDSGEYGLRVIDDPEPGYYQSAKMTRLANAAHELGAEWVWPLDADEIWYWGDDAPLAERIIEADGDVIRSRLWHHFCTALDAEHGNPFERMQYRHAIESPLGKVIIRWREGCVIEQGNHDVSMPGGAETSTLRDVQLRHFPYRSEEQFITKAINGAEAYAAAPDLAFAVGQHWREYGIHYARGGEDALREIFREHFYYDLPSAQGLVHDPTRLDS